MRKSLFSLILAVLIGVCFASLSFASSFSGADVNRSIPLKSGIAQSANTLIVGHGGVLRYLTGRATSSNAYFIVYDAPTVTYATVTAPTSGILVEGGQATQYNSLTTIDFGDSGLPFNSGLVVVTTTADVSVLYY